MVAIGAFLGTAWAQDLQPVPPLQARVTDLTGTLDAIQRQGLEDKLAALEKSKGSQVAILIVATVKPEDVFSYAQRVGTEWKIGRKGVGDGVLLVVAKDDRKMHLAVAKALEGAIPDITAKRILDESLQPNFRKGDYAAGLHAAADQLIALINGEALPPPARKSAKSGEGFDWTDMGVLLFLVVPVAAAVLKSMLGNKLGTLLTGGGAGLAAFVLTSSLLLTALAGGAALLFSLFTGAVPSPGRGLRRGAGTGATWGHGGGSWGSGGGSGSGGFSSGGGGDFGGGGASGDW